MSAKPFSTFVQSKDWHRFVMFTVVFYLSALKFNFIWESYYIFVFAVIIISTLIIITEL